MASKFFRYRSVILAFVVALSPMVPEPAYSAPSSLDSFRGTPALYRWNGKSAIIGADHTIKISSEDTFVDLAELLGFGYNELIAANPTVDPWVPEDGSLLDLPGSFILPPGQREGIVVNIPEYRLYYYRPNEGAVLSFPIGVGTADFPTPVIDSSIIAKLEKPAWYPPKSIRQEHLKENGEVLPMVVPPGPDNPLGPFAMKLKSDGYLIHGSNKKIGIGMQVSHGCIRLYNWDIERLIKAVPVGLPVRIINQPVKAAVDGAQVWIEIHPGADNDLAAIGKALSAEMARLEASLDAHSALSVDASKVRAEMLNPSGKVVQVGVVVRRSR